MWKRQDILLANRGQSYVQYLGLSRFRPTSETCIVTQYVLSIALSPYNGSRPTSTQEAAGVGGGWWHRKPSVQSQRPRTEPWGPGLQGHDLPSGGAQGPRASAGGDPGHIPEKLSLCQPGGQLLQSPQLSLQPRLHQQRPVRWSSLRQGAEGRGRGQGRAQHVIAAAALGARQQQGEQRGGGQWVQWLLRQLRLQPETSRGQGGLQHRAAAGDPAESLILLIILVSLGGHWQPVRGVFLFFLLSGGAGGHIPVYLSTKDHWALLLFRGKRTLPFSVVSREMSVCMVVSGRLLGQHANSWCWNFLGLFKCD